MSYTPTEEEMNLYKQTAYECLLAIKDVVVAKDKHNGEDIRLEQTFQYGVINTEIYKYEKLVEEVKKRIKMNEKLIKENYDIDTEIVSHLNVENTTLEFVLMMLE